MSDEALIKALRAQEAKLVFPKFDEDVAFAIGSAIRERAVAEGLKIVIAIRLWNRMLFYATVAGSSGDNWTWAARKSNVVERWGTSSYRAMIENKRERVYAANHDADPKVYALHGGAFPIIVKGTGPIGSITVSGLPEAEDHRVVVEAICDHLGMDKAKVALPA
jgi:uncharacterized protein (UPF0303 family)